MQTLESARLYAFVDTAYLNGRDPVELSRALCGGGADLIQFRAKGQPIDWIERTAERILAVTAQAGVALVINDHPALALRLGAPVCHLGQEDFFDPGHRHVDELRSPSGRLRIGLSTHAPDQAARALAAGADYIAIGPVFPTATKPGAAAVTLDYVRWASAHLADRPWFAIGGINEHTLDAVLEAGARRICIVSAILNAPDVTHACQSFRQRITSALSCS